MRIPTQVFAVAGAAAFTGAFVLSLGADETRTAPVNNGAERAIEARLHDLDQRIAELRTVARGLQRADGEAAAVARAGRRVAAADEVEDDAEDSPLVDRGAPERSPARAPTSDQMRELLDVRFSAEADDGAWNAEAETLARSELARHLPEPSRLHSLECKSSLCRAEIDQPDEGGHGEYLERLLEEPPAWAGTLMASLVEYAPHRFSTVVFLGRPGTELLSDVELAGRFE
jgi:hypothetical protein